MCEWERIRQKRERQRERRGDARFGRTQDDRLRKPFWDRPLSGKTSKGGDAYRFSACVRVCAHTYLSADVRLKAVG